MKPVVDVCVCTYKRPGPLRELLQALLAQETAGRIEIRINLVDNDHLGSGEAAVREIDPGRTRIRYEIEPVQSISLARNRAVGMATGDWVAITDDDLVPAKNWVLALFDAAASWDADIVHGRIDRQFAPGASEAILEFMRIDRGESGPVSRYSGTTANSMIRRSVLTQLEGPFDPRLGRTGGEDTDLFNRLRQRGAKAVYSKDAVVHSTFGPERCTLRWLVRRRFRHGITDAVIAPRRLTLGSFARTFAYILMLASISALYFVPGLVHGRSRRKAVSRGISTILYSANLAGRIARRLGFVYEEYKAK